MKPIQTIGILTHPRRKQSLPVAQEIQATADEHGLSTWLCDSWTPECIGDQLDETDAVVVIGGDGALLRASRLCAPFQVPVFGINMGYLGFLTESSPDQWQTCLQHLQAGNYWVESRLMITGAIYKDGHRIIREDALNDVVVGRGAAAKTVHLDAYINDEWATGYHADGLIIATATGSTAYALAAGGPILPPQLDNILMIPVAPHLSMERPVILSQGSTVKVVVSPRTDADIVVTIDGSTTVSIGQGDSVQVRVSDNRSRFIRIQGRNYFFRSLMDRLEPRFMPKNPPVQSEDE